MGPYASPDMESCIEEIRYAMYSHFSHSISNDFAQCYLQPYSSTSIQARLAEMFGCAGLIMYSDPEQIAPRDGAPVYPDGPSLPKGGVQRGSLLSQEGDPLTPGIPAIG